MSSAGPTTRFPSRLPDEAPPEGQLGVWDAGAIIIGIVIGSTIFKTPVTIFGASGGPWGGLLVWVFGGLLAFIGALCYAELATSFPRSGGDYVYLTKAFGPWAGFLFGWAQLTIVLTCSIGAMAIIFGEYATEFYKLDQLLPQAKMPSEVLYAIGAIVILMLMNMIGVVLGKLAQNLLSLLKIAGVLALIVAGFGWSESNPADWPRAEVGDFTWGSLSLILVLYAYGGWNDAAFVAAEVREPRRNIPRALLYGVGVITVLYLLVNAAYLVGLGFDVATQKGVADSDRKLLPLLLLQKPFGEMGEKAMAIVVMIAALGAVNGLTFAGARVYATLGNDHSLFSWMGHWKPGRGAPILALLVQGIITLAMVVTLGTEAGHHAVDQFVGIFGASLGQDWKPGSAFDKLFAISAPIFWIFFLATGLSLFVLRERTAAEGRPFSVPLYPILPIIFCNMCVYMTYQAIMYLNAPWMQLIPVFLVFVGLVLLGVPLYLLSRTIGYREGADDE
jgi:amino acid transporter